MATRESKLDSDIKKHCASLRRAGVAIKHIKIHGNQYTEKGTPDHHVTAGGRSFWIEAKRDAKAEASVIQNRRLTEWQEAGAVVAVCRSLTEFKQLLATHGISIPRNLEAVARTP